jgi:hypothetical protein
MRIPGTWKLIMVAARMLTAQGPDVKGGAKSYLANGKDGRIRVPRFSGRVSKFRCDDTSD